MVTGDNPDTAKAIAIKANIIREEDKDHPGAVMLGKDFIEKTGGIVCAFHRVYNCECPTN